MMMMKTKQRKAMNLNPWKPKQLVNVSNFFARWVSHFKYCLRPPHVTARD